MEADTLEGSLSVPSVTTIADAERMLEQTMSLEGRQKYQRSVRKAQERGRESTTPPGRFLLREAIPRFASHLRQWLSIAKRRPGYNHSAVAQLAGFRPELVGLIALRVVVDKLSQRLSYATLVQHLGRHLEAEQRFRVFKREHAPIFRQAFLGLKHANPQHTVKVLRARMKSLPSSWKAWKRDDRLHVGVICLDLIEKSTGLIAIRTYRPSQNPRKVHKEVVATDETLRWLESSHEYHLGLLPALQPMLCPPVPWQDVRTGGYLTGLIHQKTLVKTRSRAGLEAVSQEACPDVYAAVNRMQATEWRVNRRVLEVLDHFWSSGLQVAGMPSRDDEPLPEKPHDIAENEDARKEFRRAAARVHERNVSVRSTRVQYARTITLAREYGTRTFWFPHSLDFRGRVYPIPYFLQPQGPSYARGLLEFARGSQVTPQAAAYLAVHGANVAGHDKVSLADRVRWVEDHAAEIQAVAADPYARRSFWEAADKPWEFLAFCFEWSEYLQNPDTFESRLPVAMDGSNNGLQIYALLARDAVGGAATNCRSSTWEDRPEDLYQRVADRTWRTLGDLSDPAAEEGSPGHYANKWLRYLPHLPRGAVKRAVMTLPYGCTRYSANTYIQEWIRDQNLEPQPTYGEGWWLSGQVWSAIHEEIGLAKKSMDWLQQVAALCVEAGQAICWTAPSGFPVRQAYTKHKSMKVRTVLGDKMTYTRKRRDLDIMSLRENVNGIAPNYIHSLDAAALMLTVARLPEVKSWSMVHDSYGVPAAQAELVADTLREVYASMFSGNLLEDLKGQVEEKTGLTLPPCPERGSLDPNEVRESLYFFS